MLANRHGQRLPNEVTGRAFEVGATGGGDATGRTARGVASDRGFGFVLGQPITAGKWGTRGELSWARSGAAAVK